MTESEFNELAEEVFARIEQAIDACDADIECSVQEGVMQLEFEDGSKIVINRHGPNREIWVAAGSGGFHYAWKGDAWRSARDGSELFSTLRRLIGEKAGIEIEF